MPTSFFARKYCEAELLSLMPNSCAISFRTISELGGYAVSAITSITVQNTLGIQEFFVIPAVIVSGQIEAIMNDVQPDIVKIGMIRRVETLNVVIDALTKYRPTHIIYAPAIWSSQGEALMTEEVVSQTK